MRVLPEGLADHHALGATTLCHCWRLDLKSGEAMGFTDHDRALSFDGLTFEAETGFTASEIESSLGLSVDNLEASGALSSPRISEARIAGGDFDNAAVSLWRVNWQDVSQRVLLRSGHIGEVTRGGTGFTAELRGLAHQLNQPQGRIFQFGCDAELGDQRCGVNLADPDYSAEGLVGTCADRRTLELTGVGDFDAGHFARGRVRFLSGVHQGREARVEVHRVPGAVHVVELWQSLPEDVLPGVRVRVSAGCDKQFVTCRAKFMNAANFRGFPHMPGDDFVMRTAVRGGK